jgi:hypothetical protein
MRPSVVRAAPTLPGISRIRLPPASPNRCDGQAAKVSHPRSTSDASWRTWRSAQSIPQVTGGCAFTFTSMSRNCSGGARGPGENARRPNSEALRPDLRLSRSRSQRPVRLRSLGELEARVSLKVSTMRAGSNHARQPAVGQRDDGPDTPRRADLREGLKAQLRTGIHPDESRRSPHALTTHHRRGQSTNGSCNHPAARGLCQSLTGLKRRQASTTDWSRSRSSSISCARARITRAGC